MSTLIQGSMLRFHTGSAILSSGESLRGWQKAESVCLEQDGWESTTDTSGPVGLHWAPPKAACRSVHFLVPDKWGVGLLVD